MAQDPLSPAVRRPPEPLLPPHHPCCLLQVWRLVTNFFFMGKFSFNWVIKVGGAVGRQGRARGRAGARHGRGQGWERAPTQGSGAGCGSARTGRGRQPALRGGRRGGRRGTGRVGGGPELRRFAGWTQSWRRTADGPAQRLRAVDTHTRPQRAAKNPPLQLHTQPCACPAATLAPAPLPASAHIPYAHTPYTRTHTTTPPHTYTYTPAVHALLRRTHRSCGCCRTAPRWSARRSPSSRPTSCS